MSLFKAMCSFLCNCHVSKVRDARLKANESVIIEQHVALANW